MFQADRGTGNVLAILEKHEIRRLTYSPPWADLRQQDLQT